MEKKNKWAYASLITSDDFLPGLQCMLFSLRRSMMMTNDKSTDEISTIVLTTKQVSDATRKTIENMNGVNEVRVVEPIPNPDVDKSHVEGWVNSGYTKLHIWSLVEFEKIVYVDADALVLENVDELFERPCPAAAPDTFPPDKFNAGVMVIKPSMGVFRDMKSKIGKLTSYDTGDTGFLNAYFDNWYTMPAGHRLPFGYNALRTMYWLTAPRTKGYWNAVRPLKIVHYCSSPKPWEDTSKKGELEMLWWKFFVQSKMPLGVLPLMH